MRHEEELDCGCCFDKSESKTVISTGKDLDECIKNALDKNPQCNKAFHYEILH